MNSGSRNTELLSSKEVNSESYQNIQMCYFVLFLGFSLEGWSESSNDEPKPKTVDRRKVLWNFVQVKMMNLKIALIRSENDIAFY